jgi:beta-lactamase regulating signal transducer with metallopeptidase domain
MIELLNEWSRAWSGYFSAAAVQNTIFLLLVLAILRLLKNASAHLRYIIGLIGLIKLLIPPFIPFHTADSTSVTLTNLSFIPLGTILPGDSSIAENISTAVGGLSFVAGLFILWSISAVFYIGLSMLSTLRLRSRLHNATRLPGQIRIAQTKRKLHLFKSTEISMPLTLGLFPNRIYVPPAWDRWSPGCKQMVLLHESAHIRRMDGFFQGLQMIAQALFFFHPLVWLLNRRVNEYREMACDDASVTGENTSRAEYSKTLVEIAETIARDSLTYETASALIRRKNELFNRVHYQLKEGVMRSISNAKTTSFAIFVATLTLLFSWYPTGAVPEDVKTQAVLAKSQSNESTRFIDVAINKNEGLRLNGEQVTFDEFRNRIKAMSDEDKSNTIVNLDCSNDMPMIKLFNVQEILQKANLMKMNYKSDLRKALPLVLPSEKIRQRIKELDESDVAHLRITASGSTYLMEQKVPISSLSEEIRQLITKNDHIIISLHIEEGTTYEDFIKVLDLTKNGNAKRILINKSE